MSNIFGYINISCIPLKRKDQDTDSVMRFVSLTKKVLQNIKDIVWDTHMYKVTSLWNKYDIVVSDMEVHYIITSGFRGMNFKIVLENLVGHDLVRVSSRHGKVCLRSMF